MIQSLRKKFILVNMLLVFLVLAAVFAFLAVSGYRQAVDESMHTLQIALDRRGRPEQTLPMLEIGKDHFEPMQRSPSFVAQYDAGGQLQLLTAQSMVVSEENLAEISAQLSSAPEERQGILRDFNLRFLVRQDPTGTRVAFVDRSIEQDAIRSTIFTSVFSLLGTLVAFFFISLFLSRWALRPVETAWEQQRRFVADASHELKTPLTVIMANTAILAEHRTDTVQHQMKWVENTALEASRMRGLLDQMLFLAKSDHGAPPAAHAPVNLRDLVGSEALSSESLAFDRKLSIQCQLPEQDVFVPGDAAQLTQLLSILLDNAVKYADAGSDILLSLRADATVVQLSVNNQGEPLSHEVQAHLFDRFYRADAARSSDGYGLGLSIAQSIASSHNATITVESDHSQGTSFHLTFPMA